MKRKQDSYRTVVLNSLRRVHDLAQQVNDMQLRLRRFEKRSEPEPRLGDVASYVKEKRPKPDK